MSNFSKLFIVSFILYVGYLAYNYLDERLLFLGDYLLSYFNAMLLYLLVWIVLYSGHIYLKSIKKKKKVQKQINEEARTNKLPEDSRSSNKEKARSQSGERKEFNKDISKSQSSIQSSIVSYQVKERFLIAGTIKKFPIVVPPLHNAKILPESKSNENVTKGVSEKAFMQKLKHTFGPCVKDNATFDIPGSSLDRKYSPDAILKHSNIAVVIEIDEPYSGTLRKPTHYLNSYDVDRNNFFSQNGWIVVRFAEEQIVKEGDSCIYFLVNLINSIDPDRNFNCAAASWPKLIPQWTLGEAEKMAIEGYREKYLGIKFTPKTEEGSKVIEYDKNSIREEKPKTKLEEGTKFIARENTEGVNKQTTKPATSQQSNSETSRQQKNSTSSYSNTNSSTQSSQVNEQQRKSQTRSFTSNSSTPTRTLYSNPTSQRNTEKVYNRSANVTKSAEDIIREAISSKKYLQFSYSGVKGIIKPLRIESEGGKKYLYGKEVIFGSTRKFKVEQISKSGLSLLNSGSKKVLESDGWHAKKECLQEAIDNDYIARIVYNKDEYSHKSHDLTSLEYSKKYSSCIEAYTSQGYSSLTFSIRKISSIEVFRVSSWPYSSSYFGLDESYKERIETPLTNTASSYGNYSAHRPASNYQKEASSSGCMVLVVFVGGSMLSLLYYLL